MAELSDFEILEGMIQSPPLEKYHLSMNGGQVSLKEGKGNYKVIIRDIPADCVVIKGDSFEIFRTDEAFYCKCKRANKKSKCICNLDTVFTNMKGARKKSDYIIIGEFDGEKIIFYIELKWGKVKPFEVCKQLKGSMCFAEYIRAIGRQFWGESNFLNTEYKQRYVLIRNIGGAKSSKRNRQAKGIKGKGTSPEPKGYRDIYGEKNINFQDLI